MAAGVSVKKEERSSLSTSDIIKLAKLAREWGTEKITFFDSNGQVGGNFRAVYNLRMRLEALSKSIMYHNMDNLFKILPTATVNVLEQKIKILSNTQTLINYSSDIFATDLVNLDFKEDVKNVVEARETEVTNLDNVSADPADLLKNYKGVKETEVLVSNRYYA